MTMYFKAIRQEYRRTDELDAGKANGGSHQIQGLARKGSVPYGIEDFELFGFLAYKADQAGYDYVVLDKTRTQCCRDVPVKITLQAINSGKRLERYGFDPSSKIRHENDLRTYLALGEVYLPTSCTIKSYDELPEIQFCKPFPQAQLELMPPDGPASPVNDQNGTLPGEVMILVDLLSGCEKTPLGPQDCFAALNAVGTLLMKLAERC